jgi:hypothetical protein
MNPRYFAYGFCLLMILAGIVMLLLGIEDPYLASSKTGPKSGAVPYGWEVITIGTICACGVWLIGRLPKKKR